MIPRLFHDSELTTITEKNAKVHTIKSFTFNEKYGKDGCNAKTLKFDLKNHATGKVEAISVYDYFKRKHGVSLTYYDCPLIETERDGYFPMEACTLVPYQKYQFKLSPDQVRIPLPATFRIY